MTTSKRLSLAITLTVLALTWVHPIWPREQAMHGSLTLVGLIWLCVHDHRWPIRGGHFAAICAFFCLHSVAARYTYSNVPYDAWLQQWFGWSPQQAFGWQRNHADRLIHLSFGMCFAPAVSVYLQQRWPALRRSHAFVLTVMVVMCTSLIYEWFEWGIALTLSPEDAESYNGQQGDMWDAHMDMLLATLGALAAWPFGRRSTAASDPS